METLDWPEGVSKPEFMTRESSLVNTLPITKKNKRTVVTEAPKKVHVLLSR